MQFVICPDTECGAIADADDIQAYPDSTGKPVRIGRISCLHGHVFWMPIENLVEA